VFERRFSIDQSVTTRRNARLGIQQQALAITPVGKALNYQLWPGTASWPFKGSFHTGRGFWKTCLFVIILCTINATAIYDYGCARKGLTIGNYCVTYEKSIGIVFNIVAVLLSCYFLIRTATSDPGFVPL
jgi:hypothetical protein